MTILLYNAYQIIIFLVNILSTLSVGFFGEKSEIFYMKKEIILMKREAERERERESILLEKKLSSLEKASLSKRGTKKIAGGCWLSYFLHTPKNLIEICREVSRH